MIKADICIVGGGLAGGIIASELAKSGRRVVLLEQGAMPQPHLPEDEEWSYQRPQISFTRGEGLGGSSNYWHGALVSLDQSDVEWTALEGKHQKFPIDFSHLTSYYPRALRSLVGDRLTLQELHAPVPESSVFTLEKSKFALKSHYIPKRPISTKQLIDHAVAHHSLTVLQFKVDRIEFEGQSRAVAVRGWLDGSSEISRIEAGVFVMSAGGLGTPKILLRSASQGSPLGKLPIGQNLIDHPSGFVFKAKLRKPATLTELFGAPVAGRIGLRRRLGIKLRPEHLGIAMGRNHVVYLRPAFGMSDPQSYYELKNKFVRYRGRKVTLLEKARVLQYPDLLMESLASRYGVNFPVRYVSGFLVAEQPPQDDHRLEGDGQNRFRIRWGVSSADAVSISRFLSAFLSSHTSVFSQHTLTQARLDSGAHHSGACRMAADPTEGVVDRELRVFGTSNLFVADGSVIGYSGHSNTGLTIAALAHKCIDVLSHLTALA